MTTRAVDDALRSFGESIGWADLRLDERGACELMFSEDRQVFVVADRARAEAVIWTAIGTLPSTDTALVLLRANIFMAETRGNCLGLSDEGNVVVLSRRCAASNLDASGLADAIEAMLERAAHFSDVLRNLGTDERSSDALGADASNSMTIIHG